MTKPVAKKNHFLVVISSYKRPIYLTGLIHRLKNQSYPSEYFDISISLKGVNPHVKKSILDEDLKDFNEKKLFINLDENKNQFSNLLNTFRNIDLSNYDYICKIDDDWYHNNYLTNLNEILSNLDSPQFITSGILSSLYKNANEVYLRTYYTTRTGPSICFSSNFATRLLALEKMSNDAIKEKLLKSANLNSDIKNLYEDLILNAYAQQNNEKFIYFSLEPLFIYNRTTQSIMRPSFTQ